MKRDDSEKKRSFTIREMEIGDLGEVYALGQENFKAELWPMLYRSWDEYEVTTLFNTDGEYCLVAESDEDDPPKGERIVGFVLGTVVSKTGSAWSYGYVIWLCSHENWGREGVASKLMDKLVEIIIENEGILIIMADTYPANDRAVRFFNKKGLTDQKPHLYMSSNLEQNAYYRDILVQYRQENSQAAEQAKRKLRKLILEKRRLSNAKKKASASKVEIVVKASPKKKKKAHTKKKKPKAPRKTKRKAKR